MADALPVLPARISPSAKVRLQIAPASLPRRARRDGGCRFLPGVLRLIQFRSAALAGAGLIAGSAIAVAAAVGARVERVFAVIQKGSGVGSLHVLKVTSETERDAPQFRARGA